MDWPKAKPSNGLLLQDNLFIAASKVLTISSDWMVQNSLFVVTTAASGPWLIIKYQVYYLIEILFQPLLTDLLLVCSLSHRFLFGFEHLTKVSFVLLLMFQINSSILSWNIAQVFTDLSEAYHLLLRISWCIGVSNPMLSLPFELIISLPLNFTAPLASDSSSSAIQ